MRVETTDPINSNALQVSVYSENQDEIQSNAAITAVRNELEKHPEYSEIYYVGRGGNHAEVGTIKPSQFTIRSQHSQNEYYVVFILKRD